MMLMGCQHLVLFYKIIFGELQMAKTAKRTTNLNKVKNQKAFLESYLRHKLKQTTVLHNYQLECLNLKKQVW